MFARRRPPISSRVCANRALLSVGPCWAAGRQLPHLLVAAAAAANIVCAGRVTTQLASMSPLLRVSLLTVQFAAAAAAAPPILSVFAPSFA